MKPFEDGFPEEQKGKQEQLTVLLRRAYRQEQTLSESEQREAILRVEERLAHMEARPTSLAERTPEVAANSFTFRSPGRAARQSPVLRMASVLAMVLVVGVLIGSAAVLFTQRMYSPAGTGGKSSITGQKGMPNTVTPNSVDVKWNGLEMSMQVTAGPYFLGELLSIDISLTNHTQPKVLLGGSKDGSSITPEPCSTYSLRPELTGGTSPHYALYTEPVRPGILCPDEVAGRALRPGQSITDHFYSLLTSSGEVTLTGAAFVYLPQSTLHRPTGHLPVLHLHVASQVPANRTLSLQPEGSKVEIHAPARLQLIVSTYIVCQALPQYSQSSGDTSGGDDYWHALSTSTLQRPECSPTGSGWVKGHWIPPTQFTIALWDYAIGAAGYEVAQGHQGQYSGAHVS